MYNTDNFVSLFVGRLGSPVVEVFVPYVQYLGSIQCMQLVFGCSLGDSDERSSWSYPHHVCYWQYVAFVSRIRPTNVIATLSKSTTPTITTRTATPFTAVATGRSTSPSTTMALLGSATQRTTWEYISCRSNQEKTLYQPILLWWRHRPRWWQQRFQRLRSHP